MLSRLSPFPDSAAPPTPLVAARDGRSAPLSSQGADRQNEAALTDDARDWRDRFEADLVADVVPLGEASRRVVERAYHAQNGLGPVAANDTLHPEIPSLAVPLSGGKGVGRSASSGGGADRIFRAAVDMPFEPGAEVPAFMSRPRESRIDWSEPEPFSGGEHMLGTAILLVLGTGIVCLFGYAALVIGGPL